MKKKDKLLKGDEKGIVEAEMALEELYKSGSMTRTKGKDGVYHYKLTAKGMEEAKKLVKKLVADNQK